MISFPESLVGGTMVEGRGGPPGEYAVGVVWDMGGVAGFPLFGDRIFVFLARGMRSEAELYT